MGVLRSIGLAAAIMIFGAGGSSAQPATGAVIGSVTSASDQRPLQAALIRVVDAHLQDYSHADGGFVFPRVPAGSRSILVSAIGYRSITVRVDVAAGDTTRVMVRLEESAFQLEEIVTTGTVGARALSEVLSPTSVVSGAALDRQLDGTVAGSLRHEPGVSMSGIGASTAQPIIRGLGGDRVVVLQDGLRSGDLSSTSADHAVAIDPLNARSIEVVRGPMSLLYGSSALGGVINVIRDEIPATVPDAVHGVLTASGSSVNRGGAAGGYLTGGFGSIALRGEGSFRKVGDTRTPVGRIVNTAAETIELSGGAAYVGRAGHAGLSYRYYDNRYGIPGGFVGGHDEGVDISMQRHSVRGNLEIHPGGDRWERIVASVGVTGYRHTESEPSGEVGTRFRQTFLSGNVVARHRGLLGSTSGAIGINTQYRLITTGGSLRTPSTADVSAAAFAVQEYGTGPLRFQAGVRYDLAWYDPREGGSIMVGTEAIPIGSRTFGSASGSIGAMYRVSSAVRVGASVARAYRTPDFNELYSDGPHLAANSYDVGDPSLDPESGLGIDAFLRVETGRLRTEVAVFRNSLSNYVFPSSRGRALVGRQGGQPLFQYTNEAARFIGAEGSVAFLITPRLTLEGTGSLVQAEFTQERSLIPVIEPPDTTFVPASKHPPFIPPFFGMVELRYERPAYFAGIGARWAAAQDRLGDFEAPTDGYVIGDLHAGIRLLVGGQFHTVTLRIDNLTDAEYRDHLSRIKAIMPEPGRNVSLLYRLSF